MKVVSRRNTWHLVAAMSDQERADLVEVAELLGWFQVWKYLCKRHKLRIPARVKVSMQELANEVK